MNKNKIYLTAAEIGSLWSAYINDSMAKCVLGFMLKHIKDEDIKLIVQFAYNLSDNHLQQLHEIFTEEDFAVPTGFKENDVNMNAPWLYSDTFCLTYVNNMARVGLLAYGGSLSMSAREDIREYFTARINEVTALYNQSTETALTKGIFPRHPYIEVPKQSGFINSKQYYSGLNPLARKRPLNSIEISHLYFNVTTNSLGINIANSFAQTSPSKEVQNYMLRGREISKKHLKIFSNFLIENDIQTPHLPDQSVSESTTQTFSDKLLMFQMSLLSASGTGNYATASAASQRLDLAISYQRLSFEIGSYAKSGADIMIKYNWLEQPPGTKDKTKLARMKASH